MRILLGQRPVEIHRHRFRADMKADIVIAKNAMYQTGEHMLAAVLLRHIQPPRTIHMPMYLAPDLKRSAGQMLHLSADFLRIQNLHIVQRAMVRALSAALREKRSLIEYDGIAAALLFTADDDRGKVQFVHILLI